MSEQGLADRVTALENLVADLQTRLTKLEQGQPQVVPVSDTPGAKSAPTSATLKSNE
jgi:hypothetical protein